MSFLSQLNAVVIELRARGCQDKVAMEKSMGHGFEPHNNVDY